jgi:predicted cation transporter
MVAISSKRDFFCKLLAFIFGLLSGLILALTFALILAEMKFEPDFKGEAVDC